MRLAAIGVVAMLAMGLAAAADEARDIADANKVESAIQSAIAKAEPAVACVLVYHKSNTTSEPSHPKNRGDDSNEITPPDFYGSGVVLSSQGLILTNYHVVRGAGSIYVRLPGTRDANGVEGPPRLTSAETFAADNRSDLAVLKLWSSTPPYPVLKLGQGENLRKGTFVVSLTHPYSAGYRDGSASASWGIVSNLRRHAGDGSSESIKASKALSQLGTLIQTDSRIQMGASGGALVDMDGRLVGLTTAQAALTGVDAPGGFAIPLDANTRRIVEVLLRGEEVEYGFLGVSADPSYSAHPNGVRLTTVVPNSPAFHARLMRSDVILKVNGQAVRDQDDLFLQLGTTLAGRQAELLIRREDRERHEVTDTVKVTLVKTPISVPDKLEGVVRQSDGRPTIVRFDGKDGGIATNRPPLVYGLRVDYASVISHGSGPLASGVVVREVQSNSPAQKANLQEYSDLIIRVNDNAVTTPAEFYRQTQKAVAAGDKITLTIVGLPGEPSRTVTLP